MALKIEEIIETLRRDKIVPAETLVKIETQLEQLEQDKKADRGSTPKNKSKNEYVIIVRGDDKLAAVLQQGWVAQVKQGDDVGTLTHRMQEAAKDHNARQKRKKTILTVWRDFFQYVKRAATKSHNFHVKTKEAVRVIVLPTENIDGTV